MDLRKEFPGPWPNIIYKYRTLGELDKQEILDALASDNPVPEYAKSIISLVLSGEYKFKRGLKTDKRHGYFMRMVIADCVYFSAEDRNVPVQVVKDEFVHRFAISNRKLEQFITERNKKRQADDEIIRKLMDDK
jgi:uncharacterized membrane protein